MKKRISKYKLIKELGRGGMGEVYLARDIETGQQRALKILPPEFTRNRQYIERFRREAEAVSKLDHPHIIRVDGIGEEDGIHYIAMEYLSGPSLGSLLENGRPLSIPEAVKIIVDVAEALDFAHASGITHRDIKPDNILSDENGRFKVMDFGIARTEEGTRLTVTGAVMGTPEYMSPEQAAGKSVDQRTDIYSLGVVFYEMVTGRLPFTGQTPLEVMRMHMTKAPESPKALNPELPGNLASVISKMLEKNPADRYAGFRHVINAVAQAIPKTMLGSLETRAIEVQTKRERPPERAAPRTPERVVLEVPTSVKVALAVSLIVNVALVGLYLFRAPSRAVEQARPAYMLGMQVFAPPVEADGVMYVGAQDGTLYACNLRTGRIEWTFETGNQITAAPVVDGDRLYVGSWDKQVYALDIALGGILVWKVNVGDIVAAAPVLSDGTLFVATRGGTIYALDTATGAATWKNTAATFPKLPPAAENGMLFVEDGRKLVAYDSRAGSRLGSFSSGRLKTAPISIDDKFYYIAFDDESGRDELRFFQVEPGASSDKIRVIRPEWSIPLYSNKSE